MPNPFFDFYRVSLENFLRLQQLQIEYWSKFWQAAAQRTTRSSEDVARSAAAQVSQAAGSLTETADAANQERKGRRKSA